MAGWIKNPGFGVISEPTQLAQVYSAADLFMLPSLEDNLPNTMLESLACGTPVVGFPVGGVVDFVRTKETGFIAQDCSAEALAAALTQALQADLSSFQQQCRAVAESQLKLEVQAGRYKELYSTLLGEAQPQTELQLAGDPKYQFTVVTVVKDALQTLDRAVKSVLMQRGVSVEFRVIDGASTDGSLELLRSYGDRINLTSSPDSGIYPAMNRGIQEAQGEVLVFLNVMIGFTIPMCSVGHLLKG